MYVAVSYGLSLLQHWKECLQGYQRIQASLSLPLPRRSEQFSLARQDLGYTHLAPVLECVINYYYY